MYHRVGIKLPTIEVRYEKLSVDADVFVGGRALPTLKNATLNFLQVLHSRPNLGTISACFGGWENSLTFLRWWWFQGVLDSTGLVKSKKTTLNILHGISGVIKPARFVWLSPRVGDPSSFGALVLERWDVESVLRGGRVG